MEETEYWETVRVLRTAEATTRVGTPALDVTLHVLESNKTHRVGNVHTVRVVREQITRALTAQAMSVRLVAHTKKNQHTWTGWHTNLYPVEHPK